MKVSVFFSIGLVVGIFGVGYFYNCPSKDDWTYNYLNSKREEYMECLSSKDYRYMQEHRNFVKDMILSKRFDEEGEYPYGDNDEYTQHWYKIENHIFHDDGTLVAKELKKEGE